MPIPIIGVDARAKGWRPRPAATTAYGPTTTGTQGPSGTWPSRRAAAFSGGPRRHRTAARRQLSPPLMLPRGDQAPIVTGHRTSRPQPPASSVSALVPHGHRRAVIVTRAHSSGGQSSGLIIRRSGVQVPLGPLGIPRSPPFTDSGRPLAGADVSVVGSGASAIAHGDGTLHLTGIAAGDHILGVDRGAAVNVAAGEDPSAVVVERVTLGGAPPRYGGGDAAPWSRWRSSGTRHGAPASRALEEPGGGDGAEPLW